MDLLSRLLNPGIGFLLTLVFGFWLSRRGRPYNGLLFNVHKLIALATVVLLAVLVYRWLQGMDIAVLVILLLLIAAISVIALFTSGALMSAGRGEYRVMKLVHKISPFAFVLSMVVAAYLIESSV
jgi:hypothetical protein